MEVLIVFCSLLREFKNLGSLRNTYYEYRICSRLCCWGYFDLCTFELPKDTPNIDVLKQIWEEGGADEENPMPYLKTSICRIVSIAAVIRTEKGNGNVALSLTSLPHNVDDPKQKAKAEN